MRWTRGGRRGAGGSVRPYRVATTILLVLGVLCVLVELQSPSLIFWTGERVPGTNDGGIIYYSVDGQNRTLNSPGEPPRHPVPVTVYADPDDASRDLSSNLARGFDAVFVLSPFVAAAVVMVVGVVRRRSRRSAVSLEAGSRPSRSSPSRRSSR